MSRKKSREYSFRVVFEKFFHEPEIEFDDEEFVIADEDREFVNSLIGGVNENYDDILSIIKENTEGYDIERIYKVDLAILVLATFELRFSSNEVPPSVIINEAVELSKKYSTDKSFSFINGVLAKVVK